MKRSKHLTPLSHDHYEGLLIAGRIREGLNRQASPEVIAAYVAYFWKSHLKKHFQQEEELLLPLLLEMGNTTLAERMLGEHRLIQDLVMLTKSRAVETPEKLLELARVMKAHIRFEERELFPVLEEQVPEELLCKIGEQLQAAHSSADLSWDPPFWE